MPGVEHCLVAGGQPTGIDIPLGDGEELAGRELTCGTHRWEFDALTGQGLNPSTSQLARLPVRVREGMIEVMVEAGRSGLRRGIEL